VLPLMGVDPVPWARAQMAFTLATHIILVPLGVSWAFMTMVANYRAIKHDDADALRLAQRWSKYMAVTFAVGAVTGTVLTFEFGLLWPNFMDRFGAAFGIPFAIEGLFFFLEAIFIANPLHPDTHQRMAARGRSRQRGLGTSATRLLGNTFPAVCAPRHPSDRYGARHPSRALSQIGARGYPLLERPVL